MMQYTTVQALGQARLAEPHRQARRDELGRVARLFRWQRTTHLRASEREVAYSGGQ